MQRPKKSSSASNNSWTAPSPVHRRRYIINCQCRASEERVSITRYQLCRRVHQSKSMGCDVAGLEAPIKAHLGARSPFSATFYALEDDIPRLGCRREGIQLVSFNAIIAESTRDLHSTRGLSGTHSCLDSCTRRHTRHKPGSIHEHIPGDGAGCILNTQNPLP